MRSTIGRSPFANPTEALTFFRSSLPGEAGIRNELRGDGYFTIDISLSKAWRLGIGRHRLRFRWDVFNVTNTPKFDVGSLNDVPGSHAASAGTTARWRRATPRRGAACSSR